MAASKLSSTRVPARVLDLDDQRVFELAMSGRQREDLNAIDKATAFRDYLARFGGTQEELAGRLGLDRSTISNLIRLLELPTWSWASSAAMRSLRDTPEHYSVSPTRKPTAAAYRRIIAEHLSVRQTEALGHRRPRRRVPSPQSSGRTPNPTGTICSI